MTSATDSTVSSEGPGPPDPPAELTRRSFLTYLLGLAGALGLAGLLAPIIRYAYPVVTATVAAKLKVADLASLQPLGDAVYFDYQDSPSALILLSDGTPKAFSLVCTHFGCIVKWIPADKDFFCPCHAGKFAPDGKVISGPPPRPLTELKVVKDGTTLYVEGTV
ncbi:MAG: ubiquinol-cytochrome c reductase iron-sulfur subunit [Actinobacteria bacterium]|nr:ubiquinol-cytochrome c reductase iron-sulfur subunit [Actinomycetota bacterium]